ncbi:MAG: NAD-dependent epimerase/dehydratase family protein, partial [Anaerolineae bacterium]|nr:NAD-dependent epimerase/dehydratase family protein [Anaerolineae bacterium]
MQPTQTYTYLITGGAGFIGSHMVRTLVNAGHTVYVVDNFSTGKRKNLAPVQDQITLHEISITDLEPLQAAMQGVDYVFHFAAMPSVPRSVEDPLGNNQQNVTGTLNVLLAARNNDVKRVVYAGSSSAYGGLKTDYAAEDMQPQPMSPYAVAKLAAEHYCQAFTHV